MTDRPIIFSAPMVRALLDGRKTQTRRVLKPQPEFRGGAGDWNDPEEWGWEDEDGAHLSVLEIAPNRFACGDRLWVRERFAVSGIGWGKKPSEACGGKVHYSADPDHGWQDYWGSWRPSIHMPRWASRITLTVTDVRVQRLQAISEADAVAEGIERYKPEYPSLWRRGALKGDQNNVQCTAFPKLAFRSLWEDLHGPEAWERNPWVCALTFTVQRGNIDQVAACAS